MGLFRSQSKEPICLGERLAMDSLLAELVSISVQS